jgi:hypothetical protein
MTKNVSIFQAKNLTKQQELYGLDTGTESGKKYLESGFRGTKATDPRSGSEKLQKRR